MKVEELAGDLFVACPRYITLERFAELTGFKEQKKMLARWVAEGALPTRCFGRHRMIDMHALLQRLSQAKGTQG